jgi:hypothetical protein
MTISDHSRRGLCTVVLACFFALGCGGSGEEPPPPANAVSGQRVATAPADAGDAGKGAAETVPDPPAPSTLAEPTLVSAGAPSCEVGRPTVVHEGGERMQSLEVGFGPRGGLIAWPRSKTEVALLPIGSDGAPAGPAAKAEMPGARHVHAVIALDDRLVVTTHDLCPDKKYFFKCLYAQALDAAGNRVGELITEVTKEWIRDEFHERIGPASIFILRSHMYVPPVINEVALEEGGALQIGVVHELGGKDELSWARGFAAHEQRWFVIVESELGAVTLRSKDGKPRPLNWLAPASRVLAFDRHADRFLLLFAPELPSGKAGRPRVAVFDEQGVLEGKPRKLGEGEPLPAPFADRVEAVFERKGGNLVFRRKSAAGDAIGESTVVAPFPTGGRDDPRLALGWTGDRFVAVWSSFEDRKWKIYSAAVSCRNRG